MTAQQLVDYLKSQGVDLKSGSGPVITVVLLPAAAALHKHSQMSLIVQSSGTQTVEVQLPTLQQLTQNPVQIGSKMGKFDPRRFLAQSARFFKTRNTSCVSPSQHSSQGFNKEGIIRNGWVWKRQ